MQTFLYVTLLTVRIPAQNCTALLFSKSSYSVNMFYNVLFQNILLSIFYLLFMILDLLFIFPYIFCRLCSLVDTKKQQGFLGGFLGGGGQ